jgi:hypothetical protein
VLPLLILFVGFEQSSRQLQRVFYDLTEINVNRGITAK